MTKKMVVGVLAGLLMLGTGLSAPLRAEAPRPEIATSVKAYAGAEGLKVWTLRIGPRTANEALVQIGGIDHDWDMKIQKMQVERVNGSDRYWTSVAGKKFVVLVLREGRGEVYLPGEADAHWVSYDADLSGSGNAQHFLTDYLEQR